MTNTELFGILGQIDDKFYEEVVGGDSEKPMKISIAGSRSNPFRMAAIAAAACLIIGIGAGLAIHLSNRGSKDNIVVSNISEYYGDFSVANISDCKKQILAEFPELEKYETGGDTRALQTQAMDINCDGAYEAVLFSKAKKLMFVFVKVNDRMQLADTVELPSSVFCMDSLSDLHKYDGDGESFWYYGIHIGSSDTDNEVSAMARISFANSAFTVDFPLAYGHVIVTEQFIRDNKLFYKTDWNYVEGLQDTAKIDPSSNITREEFEALWSKYDGLPEFSIGFYLEYPILSSSYNIPEVNDPSEMSNAIEKARLELISYNDYSIWLLGENIFHQKNYTDDYIFMTDMAVALVKDGKIVSKESIILDNDYTSVKDGKYIQYGISSKGCYFCLYDLKDADIITYVDKYGFESNFFAVKDGRLIPLRGKTSPDSSDIGYNAHASISMKVLGNSLVDENGGKFRIYNFNPEAFDADPNIVPHFTTGESDSDVLDINKYVHYDPASNEMTMQAVISEKQVGNYTVRLLGHNVQTIHDEYPHTKYEALFISLERGGKEVSRTEVQTGMPGDLDAKRLDDYIFTFEMKGGIGFGVYTSYSYNVPGIRYAWLYSIKNDLLFNFNELHNYAPIDYNSPVNLDGGYKIIPEENKIDFNEGGSLVLDFQLNTYFSGENFSKVKSGKVLANSNTPSFDIPFGGIVSGTENEWLRFKELLCSGEIDRIDITESHNHSDLNLPDTAAPRIMKQLFGAQMVLDKGDNPATGGSDTVFAYDENGRLILEVSYDSSLSSLRFADDANTYVFSSENSGLDLDRLNSPFYEQ